MDQQAAAMESIGGYIAQRYPMYVTDPGFEQWLYGRAGLDRETLDRYLALLDDYGYLSRDGKLAGDYRSLPDPAHIRDDIERRLARLAPAVVDALRTASVVGDRFGPEMLELLLDAGNAGRLLGPAMQAGLIAPESNVSTIPALAHQYRFVPLQTRQVLYEQLSDEERVLLHGRFVEILSQEVEKVSDPGAQDMLHHLISEHNKVFSRPDPPSSK